MRNINRDYEMFTRTGIDFRRACRTTSNKKHQEEPEPRVPTKRAESSANSNNNCGVKGSRVDYDELSLFVFLSRREDGAKRKET